MSEAEFLPVFATKERHCIADEGILYCGFGDAALQEAVFSAQSVKNCSTLPTAIFSDNEHAALESGVFDYVYGFEPFSEFKSYFVDSHRLPSLKLFPLLSSPFKRTLHLDADTFVRGDLSEVFKLLGHFDVLLTNEAQTEKSEPHPDTGHVAHVSLSALSRPAMFNAGVFAYSDSAAATAFIKYWIAHFLRVATENPDSGNWRGINDQQSLHAIIRENAVAKTGVRQAILPNYKYNATGRMLRELHRIGLYDQAKIFHTHFCSSWAAQGGDMNSLHKHPEFEKFDLSSRKK